MPTNFIYRGDAPAYAQVQKITPTAPAVGDTFYVACNGKKVQYVAASTDPDDVVAGLVALLQATTLPEFQEVLVSASEDGDYFTLVSVTPGVPFEVQVSTSHTTAGSVQVTRSQAGAFPVNAVHRIALVGTYTGGNFTISYDFGSGTETTVAINHNANAATMQAALEGLTTPVPGDVTVTGGPGPNSPWFVTWKGALGGMAITPGTINGTNLVGNGSVQIQTTTEGNGLSDEIQLLDCSVAHFQGTGMTFNLSLDGQLTSQLNTNSTAAQIQTALESLPNVGAGNVLVYGQVINNTEPQYYAVHFTGALAQTNVSQLAVVNFINPGSPAQTPTVTTLQNGGQTISDDFQWVSLNSNGSQSISMTYAGVTNQVGGTAWGNTTYPIQDAIQAISTVGANNLTVYLPAVTTMAGQIISAFLVRFTGSKANTRQSLFSVTGSTTGAGTVTRLSIGNANVNEVQTITIFATGGNFKLTSGAQTTSNIAWNAANSVVDTRIEADLSATITSVTVTGSGTIAAPYVVTVTGPAHTDIAQMTGDATGLTGGGGTITSQTTGAAGVNEIQIVTLAAGVNGGTFLLEFGGIPTVAIAYNAAHGTVETDLQALATINTVAVAGSNGGPYTVTWGGAQGLAPQALLIGDGSNLTGATGTQNMTIETLTFSSGPHHFDDPLNWVGGRVPDSGGNIYFESGTVDCLYGLDQLATFTVNAGTDVVTFTSRCNLQTNQIVRVTSDGTLPAGLSAGTDYYLLSVNRDAGTCQLTTSQGGSAVNITNTGAGTHTIGLRAAYIEFGAKDSGLKGLGKVSDGGYYEYRERNMHVGLAADGTKTIAVGTGEGSGSQRVNLDTGPDETHLRLVSSGGSIETGIPPVLWKGTNPANTVEIVSGDLGIAIFAGETAVVDSPKMRAGSLTLGAKVTVTGTIDQTGGKLKSLGATIDGACILT